MRPNEECLLLETVRFEDGKPLHLRWHEDRIGKSLRELDPAAPALPYGWPGCEAGHWPVPDSLKYGTVKCRIRYDSRQIREIAWEKYRRTAVRSLRLIEAPALDYHLKYADRSELLRLRELRGGCDDILICRNGYLTDTSYANLLLYDGYEWYTPAHCLLEGTCRQRLLTLGRISERPVHRNDLKRYREIRIINALNDPGEQPGLTPREIE